MPGAPPPHQWCAPILDWQSTTKLRAIVLPIGPFDIVAARGKRWNWKQRGGYSTLCRIIVMSWGKANLAALVSCLCSKEPGSPEDFVSVIQLLALQHCAWQPRRCSFSSSKLAISQLQTRCWGRAGSNFPNSAVNASSPNFLQSNEPCQVPHNLCFFQMVSWVSQMVLGTCGCAAGFHPNFSGQNILVLSSRILLQTIFKWNFYFLLTISFWNERPFFSEFQKSL